MVTMALTLFLFCCFLYIILLKTNWWHCSCCHRYLDKQNKTYQRLHENSIHMDFSLKGCHIFNAIYHDLDTVFPICPPMFCYYIILIQNKSYPLEYNRGYFDDLWLKQKLFQIKELHSMACFLQDHSDKIYTNIFAIYMILCIKIYIHACVWCYYEWQSQVTLSKWYMCFLIKADKQMDMVQVKILTRYI